MCRNEARRDVVLHVVQETLLAAGLGDKNVDLVGGRLGGGVWMLAGHCDVIRSRKSLRFGVYMVHSSAVKL